MDISSNIKLLERQELVTLVQDIDTETKDYCIDDCIKCWDEKNLWGHRPWGLVIDGKLKSVIFWNLEVVDDQQVAYIQRLFNPVEARGKGHFTQLLTELYKALFDNNYRFVKLFMDKKVALYQRLNFTSLFDTRDQKYSFCLQPMLSFDLKLNNVIVAQNGVHTFYTKGVMDYIESQIIKYA